MNTDSELTRREFLKSFSVSGAGLLIGIYLSGCSDATPGLPTVSPSQTPTNEPTIEPTETPRPTPNPDASFDAGIFLRVDGTGKATVYMPKTELGQGTLTSMAMIVAEELYLALDQVQIELCPMDPRYGDLRTGGSDSISGYFVRLSKAGATARAVLITAASQLWDVPYETCRADDGQVIHDPTGQYFTYAELVETAAEIQLSDVVSNIETKNPAEFEIIGTHIGHMDLREIVDGSTVYGVDIHQAGMLYATIKRCPVVRGKVTGYDGSQALSIPGVKQVFEINSSVAVVADSTWAALQGQNALDVTWDEGRYQSLSSAAVREELTGRLNASNAGTSTENPEILAAIYEVPFLAHATPEPMNCAADVGADFCEIWAPTQNPQQASIIANGIAHFPRENFHLHIPRVGGGFGRRLKVDYVEEAVRISMQAGAPVKVLWTREEDIQHGYFHPLSIHHASVNLDNPEMPRLRSETFDGWDDLTYAWRSVTNFTDAFVQECFLDEMATALGRDPYELRIELEPSPLLEVLELAANKASWGEPLPQGWGRGIACWSTWNVTPVAQVAEVSVSANGIVRVERVVCAIDCGIAVNPDMVEAQMEGGVVWGLTAALKGAIEFENGRVQQSNFDDYPLLRMDEMPLVEVHIIKSDRRPTGVGEMGVPPAAPAVLNAIYNATGKRIRHLPVRPEDLI